MFITQCIKSVQLYVPEFENGLVPHIGVDYRLFHQSLLAMNDVKRRARVRPPSYRFPSLAAQNSPRQLRDVA